MTAVAAELVEKLGQIIHLQEDAIDELYSVMAQYIVINEIECMDAARELAVASALKKQIGLDSDGADGAGRR